MAESGVYNGEDYDKLREDDSHYKEVEEDINRLTEIYAQAFDSMESQMRTFETGATRDTDEGKLDWEGFISPAAMRHFAEYMHKHRRQADGTLRDADNWQKGMPRREYVRSLVRHTWDLWALWRWGYKSIVRNDSWEEQLVTLLCAILFNVQGLLHEIAIGRDVSE